MNIQPKLIKECIAQNRRSEYELYKLTYSYLMSISIRYTKNEDLAKEYLNISFLKILNNLKTYKEEIPFKAWIRKILINTLIDEYRKQKKLSEVIDYTEKNYDSTDFTELNSALEHLNTKDIYKEIAKLPPVTKQVFNLFVIDGYTHKEIAQLLNIEEGTSKWHLNAGRTKLKIALEKEINLYKVEAQ
ncbi:MAG: RNA polymerase sigma factor [Bacteroidota bacterium]